ncbi:MAG: putative sugar phosphate nucleotidyl transferase [Bacteroidetes bacterium]|nr:MAG: putative sugar phosphate nucleotidyl transferase [Bacteroidota bacterium]
MSIAFLETERENLLPLTWTRPVADIRVGILTIREKWALAGLDHSGGHDLEINNAVCPTPGLMAEIKSLERGHSLWVSGFCIASSTYPEILKIESKEQPTIIRRPYDIFCCNDAEIKNDFELLTKGRKSQPLPGSNTVVGSGEIFLEKGAKVEASVLNASAGPIYIGEDAEVMEGCMIRGPFALGAHAVLKMGAKIYGATTIGPGCKAGGEVNNSVFFANSNKAHDGFIGNSVIGEWCNLGADTNCSNLKNTYGEVDVYNYASKKNEGSGLQFCGLIMGDHAKCGINTMFNTGTVVGVCANVFGGGFPPKFIPDFSWGNGVPRFDTCQIDKAMETIARVWERRGKKLEEKDKALLETIFAQTSPYRLEEE